MRITHCLLLTSLFGLGFVSAPGCGGSNEAEVAPRTQAEIEAYKQDAYGAEEEEDSETPDEDE